MVNRVVPEMGAVAQQAGAHGHEMQPGIFPRLPRSHIVQEVSRACLLWASGLMTLRKIPFPACTKWMRKCLRSKTSAIHHQHAAPATSMAFAYSSLKILGM